MSQENSRASRKNSPQRELNEQDVEANPLKQFDRWFADAVEAGIALPNAMALATAKKTGEPSVRMVLMKDFDEHGFVFYSNYESRKGKDLEDNPQASLLFHWAELERQVRVYGTVGRIPREESEAYFHSRQRKSRLNAWASNQSRPLKDRRELDDRFRSFDERYANKVVPLPSYWGGYRLVPVQFEFWQGRPYRMHDRIQYTLENARWKIVRLAP
jgi:pyridoxamine 5'-phosphate oxidase